MTSKRMTRLALLLWMCACVAVSYAAQYVVTNEASLAAAFTATANGDTILITETGSVMLTKTNILNGKSVLVKNEVSANPVLGTAILDCGFLPIHAVSILSTNPATQINVSFVGITFRNCMDSAIFASGSTNVAVSKCFFLKNNSSGSNGGAIDFSVSDGALGIFSSSFRSNVALGGGAVYTGSGASLLRIDDSYFEDNRATWVQAAKGSGGAVQSRSSVVQISSSTFVSNVAVFGGGALAFRYPDDPITNTGSGGVYQLSVTSCLFRLNVATGGYGGAVLIAGTGFNVALFSNANFSRNSAFLGGGGLAVVNSAILSQSGYSPYSPAPYNASDALWPTLLVTNGSGFYYNAVTYNIVPKIGMGGGIATYVPVNVTLSDSVLSVNSAPDRGSGASFSGWSVLQVHRCVVEFNMYAPLPETATVAGGLFVDGNSRVSIIGSTFDSNRCRGFGGALLLSLNSTLNIVDSNFMYQTVFSFGISSFGSVAKGGAVYVLDNSVIRIDNSTFLSNFSPDNGGGIAAVSPAALSVYNVSCLQNSAGSLYGGCLHITNASSAISIVNSFFSGNTAQYRGGAVFISGASGPLIFSGNVWQANFVQLTGAGSGAGDLFAASAVALSLQKNTFSQSGAIGSGGSIALLDVISTDIVSCSFSATGSTLNGGAVNVQRSQKFPASACSLALSATTFTGTTSGFCASCQGGAVFVDTACAITVTNSSFQGNIGGVGGAIAVSATNSSLSVHTSSFYNNSARSAVHAGGAISFQGTILSAIQSSFLFNKVSAASSIASITLNIGNRQTFNGIQLLGGNTSFFGSSSHFEPCAGSVFPDSFINRTTCPNSLCSLSVEFGDSCSSVCPGSFFNGTRDVSCSSAGFCNTTVGKCVCNDGFFGVGCNKTCVLGSNGQMCSGNGYCDNSDPSLSTYGTCACQPGFAGSACNNTCPVHAGQSCSGRGVCVATVNNGAFECACHPDFFGVFCNETCPLSPVSGLMCSGRGICLANLSCLCNATYFGPSCNLQCPTAGCGAGGYCNESTGGQCFCPSPQFASPSATNCSACAADYYPFGECNVFCNSTASCSGRGSCDTNGSCICDVSWTGSHCNVSTLVDNSTNANGTLPSNSSLPASCDVYANCSGHGTCLSNGSCLCDSPWMGLYCNMSGFGNSTNITVPSNASLPEISVPDIPKDVVNPGTGDIAGGAKYAAGTASVASAASGGGAQVLFALWMIERIIRVSQLNANFPLWYVETMHSMGLEVRSLIPFLPQSIPVDMDIQTEDPDIFTDTVLQNYADVVYSSYTDGFRACVEDGANGVVWTFVLAAAVCIVGYAVWALILRKFKLPLNVAETYLYSFVSLFLWGCLLSPLYSISVMTAVQFTNSSFGYQTSAAISFVLYSLGMSAFIALFLHLWMQWIVRYKKSLLLDHEPERSAGFREQKSSADGGDVKPFMLQVRKTLTKIPKSGTEAKRSRGNADDAHDNDHDHDGDGDGDENDVFQAHAFGRPARLLFCLGYCICSALTERAIYFISIQLFRMVVDSVIVAMLQPNPVAQIVLCLAVQLVMSGLMVWMKPFDKKNELVVAWIADVSDVLQLLTVGAIHGSDDASTKDGLATFLYYLQFITILLIMVFMLIEAISDARRILIKVARYMKRQRSKSPALVVKPVVNDNSSHRAIDDGSGLKTSTKSYQQVTNFPKRIHGDLPPLDLQSLRTPSPNSTSFSTPRSECEALDDNFLKACTQISLLPTRAGLTTSQKLSILRSWWYTLGQRPGMESIANEALEPRTSSATGFYGSSLSIHGSRLSLHSTTSSVHSTASSSHSYSSISSRRRLSPVVEHSENISAMSSSSPSPQPAVPMNPLVDLQPLLGPTTPVAPTSGSTEDQAMRRQFILADLIRQRYSAILRKSPSVSLASSPRRIAQSPFQQTRSQSSFSGSLNSGQLPPLNPAQTLLSPFFSTEVLLTPPPDSLSRTNSSHSTVFSVSTVSSTPRIRNISVTPSSDSKDGSSPRAV
eukprot:ANDGO_04118.mRNA.1 Teneurin-a